MQATESRKKQTFTRLPVRMNPVATAVALAVGSVTLAGPAAADVPVARSVIDIGIGLEKNAAENLASDSLSFSSVRLRSVTSRSTA